MKSKEESTPPRGIECPRCGCRHFEVTNTEPLRGGRIRRRKRCRHCGHRIVTYEGTVTTLRDSDCYR
jgi:transcriptional regulator NrdR family protein